MRRALTILVLIWLPLGAAPADVYRSVDAQGHVQYSDVPSPGAERISTVDSAAASSAEAGKDSGLEKQGQQISQQLAAQAAARAVQKDTTAARAEQCKQAQDAYQKAVEARHIYKTGPDGQREYLSDEEADQQRVSYRLAMEEACKDSNSDSDSP